MSGPQSRGVDHLGNISLVYGHSPAIERVNAMVPEIARTDIPVLLIGESGTGKEVYGRLIHRLSQRGHMPLKKLSCRALERSELHAQLRCDSKSGAEGPEEDLRTLFLDGIDEHPIKSHARRPFKMLAPARHWTSQKWKEII